MDLPAYRYPVTTKALVLGGGAPNATLMAGAVCAFHRHGVRFDLISSAGAGALIGLLAVAPKNQTPEEALRRTVNYGVDDLIYSFVPVNYKVFQKRLPVGEPLRALAKCALGANPLYAQTRRTSGSA